MATLIFFIAMMDQNRYEDLVAFIESDAGRRKWPAWIISETDRTQQRYMKANFRRTALGSKERAGFLLQNGRLYKKVFKDKEKMTYNAPRLVVLAKDVQKMLRKVHDEASG